jgi:hypothetical protein
MLSLVMTETLLEDGGLNQPGSRRLDGYGEPVCDGQPLQL